MPVVRIPHGITPTGFGIKQRSNGAFRPISPCCGASLRDSTQVICNGCDKVYGQNLPHRLGASLTVDVGGGVIDASTRYIIEEWIQNVTGIKDLRLEVTK